MSLIRDLDSPNGLLPENRQIIFSNCRFPAQRNVKASCRLLDAEIEGQLPKKLYKPDKETYANYKFLVDQEYEEVIPSGPLFLGERSLEKVCIDRQKQDLPQLRGYYIVDTLWLANYGDSEHQEWSMHMAEVRKPDLIQIALVLCLSREKNGPIEKLFHLVSVPTTAENDIICESILQDEQKFDLSDFYNLQVIEKAEFLMAEHVYHVSKYLKASEIELPEGIDPDSMLAQLYRDNKKVVRHARKTMIPIVLKITFGNGAVNYLQMVMSGPEQVKKTASAVNLKIHAVHSSCALRHSGLLDPVPQQSTIMSFVDWYRSAPIELVSVDKVQQERYVRGVRAARHRTMDIRDTIKQREANWKVSDPRRLMYLVMGSVNCAKGAGSLKMGVVPGLDMRVVGKARAIADRFYDDQFVQPSDATYEYLSLNAWGVTAGLSKRAQKSAFNRQKRILSAINRKERARLRAEHSTTANLEQLDEIYRVHGVLEIDLEQVQKNTPKTDIPNVRGTTLVLRYGEKSPVPQFLLLPSHVYLDLEHDRNKFCALLRSVNRGAHCRPDNWWEAIDRFLNSKHFAHGIREMSSAGDLKLSAVVKTDISYLNYDSVKGMKSKLQQLLPPGVKVYEPKVGKCHLALDGSLLSLEIRDTEHPSDMVGLVELVRLIQSQLPELVRARSIVAYKGIITAMAIRVEVPCIQALEKFSRGYYVAKALMKWGRMGRVVLDMVSDAAPKQVEASAKPSKIETKKPEAIDPDAMISLQQELGSASLISTTEKVRQAKSSKRREYRQRKTKQRRDEGYERGNARLRLCMRALGIEEVEQLMEMVGVDE